MAKAKTKKVEVAPIINPLNAVVKDFKRYMKLKSNNAVKLKSMTYDEVLEALVDYCQASLAERAQQEKIDQA
jgi:hypothetical protein